MMGMHNTQYPNEDVILLVVSSVWNISSSSTWFLTVQVKCVTSSKGLISEATVECVNKSYVIPVFLMSFQFNPCDCTG